MAKYLGQAVAVEKDIREKTKRALTEAHHLVQNTGLLNGQERDYTPLVEDESGGAEHLPSVRERVQYTVAELIDSVRDSLAAMFDATAAKDWTNMGTDGARADVRVGDQVIVEGAPVPYLLWLEKQLDDLETFVAKLPTHDPSTEWTLTDPRGVYSSTPQDTMRQVQQPRSRVVVPPTDHHPAQVQGWTENVPVGRWTARRLTGSIPVAQRAAMLQRIYTLQRAVDVAREEGNRAEAAQPALGRGIVQYVFG